LLLENLRPTITRTPLLSTTRAYGQFPGRGFNPLDKSVVTAYYETIKVNPNMFIALVAKEDFLFGLARMWEAFAYKPPFETMVFKKMDDAQQWIREKFQKKP